MQGSAPSQGGMPLPKPRSWQPLGLVRQLLARKLFGGGGCNCSYGVVSARHSAALSDQRSRWPSLDLL
jgi:hypothetical protein